MSTTATKPRRKRRSPEQIISDLEAEIKRVKERQKLKELQEFESVKCLKKGMKQLAAGMDAAKDEGDAEMRHVIADAWRPIERYFKKHGITVEKIDMPKGPRPR